MVIITIKRFFTWLGTIILEAILSLIFANKLKATFMFIKNYFIELFLLIIIGTTIIFITIWFIKYLIYNINYIRVKQKYYDIMFTKFNDLNPASVYNVNDLDLDLFTKTEKKYLKDYINSQNNLKVIMKGKNKVIGMFK